VRLWRRAYCREAVTRRAEEEPRRRTSVSFFLWRTTEQAGVPLGGFARKNGRWVGLRLFAFRWTDSISQFEPSYIHTTVRRTHTNTHTLHAYMTGGPAIWGPRAAAPPANTTGPALPVRSYRLPLAIINTINLNYLAPATCHREHHLLPFCL